MAVLHKKEEKIKAVLEKLPQKYNEDDFVAAFIKFYGKDWGKIKSAYTKQSQDKEPGTIIKMPKPEVYLKQLLANYLKETPNTEDTKPEPSAPVVAAKKVTIKKELINADKPKTSPKAKGATKK